MTRNSVSLPRCLTFLSFSLRLSCVSKLSEKSISDDFFLSCHIKPHCSAMRLAGYALPSNLCNSMDGVVRPLIQQRGTDGDQRLVAATRRRMSGEISASRKPRWTGINAAARGGRAIARPVRLLPRTETLALYPYQLSVAHRGRRTAQCAAQTSFRLLRS